MVTKRSLWVAEFFDLVLAVAQLARIVEVREVTVGEACVGIHERLDDLGVDLVADVGFALESDHIPEAGTLGYMDGWRKPVVVAVLVGDVVDEQHEQHVVLALAGTHAAAQFVARG
jgi:hypothetical protein